MRLGSRTMNPLDLLADSGHRARDDAIFPRGEPSLFSLAAGSGAGSGASRGFFIVIRLNGSRPLRAGVENSPPAESGSFPGGYPAAGRGVAGLFCASLLERVRNATSARTVSGLSADRSFSQCFACYCEAYVVT